MKKTLFALIFVLATTGVYAQYDVHYTMFMFNKLSINPAYAGNREVLTLRGHYRNQWQGISGAPQTFTFSMDTPFFKKRAGLGLSVIADKIGMMNTYFTNISYAYRMKLDNDNILSVGIDGQLEYGRINWAEADPFDQGDGHIPVAPTTKLNPNFGIGVYLSNPNYYVGLSIPRIFRTSVFDDEPLGDVVSLNSVRSYYLMAGLIKRLNKNIVFQPGVLMTYNPNSPFELDINASLVFFDRLWVGLSYRLEDSFDAVVQFQINNQLKVALAADMTLTELKEYSPGSFEIMLEYTFVKEALKLNNIRYF